jgi:hypothetical protein
MVVCKETELFIRSSCLVVCWLRLTVSRLSGRIGIGVNSTKNSFQRSGHCSLDRNQTLRCFPALLQLLRNIPQTLDGITERVFKLRRIFDTDTSAPNDPLKAGSSSMFDKMCITVRRKRGLVGAILNVAILAVTSNTATETPKAVLRDLGHSWARQV